MIQGGQVFIAPVGADPSDPSMWTSLSMATSMEVDSGIEQFDNWWSDSIRVPTSSPTYTLTTEGPISIPAPARDRKKEQDMSDIIETQNGGKVEVSSNLFGEPLLSAKPYEGACNDNVILDGNTGPELASAILNSPEAAGAELITLDGRDSFTAGGKQETSAIVYRAESDAQAERNLNFAIANLKAWADWNDGGKERLIERLDKAFQEACKAEGAAYRDREHLKESQKVAEVAVQSAVDKTNAAALKLSEAQGAA